MTDSNSMLPLGAKLQNGRYKIKKHLGSGGFGKTYLAVDTKTGKQIVIKEFFMRDLNLRKGTMVNVSVPSKKSDFENQRSKFKKEANRLQKLEHSNIVKVHGLFEENNTAYYVMNYIEGGTLNDQLKINGPLPEEKVLSVLFQLLSALQQVHEQHLIHMDLKPSNILLGRNNQVYLIDFGASKLIEYGGKLTSNVVPYTKRYAPSEQLEGSLNKIGPWTDIYALGATLYNMLTLQVPPEMSDIIDSGDGAFVYSTPVSKSIRELVRWMMQPKRSERPQSVKEVQEYLQQHGFFYKTEDKSHSTKGADNIVKSNKTELETSLGLTTDGVDMESIEETIYDADSSNSETIVDSTGESTMGKQSTQRLYTHRNRFEYFIEYYVLYSWGVVICFLWISAYFFFDTDYFSWIVGIFLAASTLVYTYLYKEQFGTVVSNTHLQLFYGLICAILGAISPFVFVGYPFGVHKNVLFLHNYTNCYVLFIVLILYSYYGLYKISFKKQKNGFWMISGAFPNALIIVWNVFKRIQEGAFPTYNINLWMLLCIYSSFALIFYFVLAYSKDEKNSWAYLKEENGFFGKDVQICIACLFTAITIFSF